MKVQLKYGLAEYFKQSINKLKYSHAFPLLLTAKDSRGPIVLSKDEKAYLRTAIWSEYSMELPQTGGAKHAM
jgi:hypothetical protein